MKLFYAVIREDDGVPTKEDGKRIQKLRDVQYFYAATSIEDVFSKVLEEIERLNQYSCAEFLKIEEIAGNITILDDEVQK